MLLYSSKIACHLLSASNLLFSLFIKAPTLFYQLPIIPPGKHVEFVHVWSLLSVVNSSILWWTAFSLLIIKFVVYSFHLQSGELINAISICNSFIFLMNYLIFSMLSGLSPFRLTISILVMFGCFISSMVPLFMIALLGMILW